MSPLSAIYLGIFLVYVPALALRSHRAIAPGRPLPARKQLFAQIIIMQFLFGAFSIYVARFFEIPLFPRFEMRWSAVAAAVAACVAMLATIPARWRAATPELKRRLMQTRPRTMSDMGPWAIVSAAAGFSEEITYRGVLFAMLWYFTGSPWTAALTSAAAFSAGHAAQGWRAALVIFFFALAAQGIAWLAGSLYVVMLLHFAYDFAAGFIYMRLCRDEPAVLPQPPT